jgi:hypothetical protein
LYFTTGLGVYIAVEDTTDDAGPMHQQAVAAASFFVARRPHATSMGALHGMI